MTMREALDYAWGAMPVADIQAMPPDLRDLCALNHVLLNHPEAKRAQALADLGDPIEMLLEWYRWWEVALGVPPKLPRALHVRTAMMLVNNGHPEIMELEPSAKRN